MSGLHSSSWEAASRASAWRAARVAPVSTAASELAVSSSRSASPSISSTELSSGAVSAFTANSPHLRPCNPSQVDTHGAQLLQGSVCCGDAGFRIDMQAAV